VLVEHARGGSRMRVLQHIPCIGGGSQAYKVRLANGRREIKIFQPQKFSIVREDVYTSILEKLDQIEDVLQRIHEHCIAVESGETLQCPDEVVSGGVDSF
jgi:hypothetical protein